MEDRINNFINKRQLFHLQKTNYFICKAGILYCNVIHARLSFHCGCLQVKLKCLQMAASIFQCPHRDVSTPYIHALGPRLVEYLQSTAGNIPQNDESVAVIIESIRVLEILVGLTDESHSKSRRLDC